MRKVFADSSVLIAGAASRTGASRAVLTMAEIGLFQLVVSEQVLEECQRNLSKKLPAALPIFTQLLAAINPKIQPNPPLAESTGWTALIEAKDAPILAAAVLAKVDRLLSLNTKDFTPEVAAQSGIIIQTPAEFVREIREIVERGLQ
ncbi:MAG: PIN domain-containing protein [Fischerella sp.]|jgi:predicted nucleic acid-binding protein|uniref:PIN domain-containing protein n=1 Tax=Fischerella sp. TaxID=1191 RepID=UPI001853468D|nr:PIN domain-containing protein [Fischerella sp.]NWF59640.1 PIN domain-containing protein [Fischerella sp.]